MNEPTAFPKLLQITKPIITLTKEIKFTTGIISIEFDKPIESQTELSISFHLIARYSNFPYHYTLSYSIENSFSNTLMTLLYFLKYKCPSLYNKKHLIMEFIYKPFLRVKFIYSHCQNNGTTKLKGGVYAITPAIIDNRDCLISGGWVFAIYRRNEFTYKNIIANVWDECILSLALYKDNHLLTGYKSGKVKLWAIESFHQVKFITCYFNKFNTEILAIYYTDVIIFFEKQRITVWKELEEEIYSYQCEEGIIIQCSEVYSHQGVSYVFFGDSAGKLNIMRIDKENSNKNTVDTIQNETDKGVYSLKLYKESSLLFVGTKKGVQLWNIIDNYNNNINGIQIELKDFHYLNDEINYITYIIYKDILYLFCGGKEPLFLIHLKL